VTPLAFRFRDALPHFGHFMSFESLVGLDKVGPLDSLRMREQPRPFIGLRVSHLQAAAETSPRLVMGDQAKLDGREEQAGREISDC